MPEVESRYFQLNRGQFPGRVTQFGHYSDLWVHDLARGVGTRITFDDNDISSGIWSHDDTRIFFSASGQDHYSVYGLDASGAGVRRLVLDNGVDLGPSDVSPDGHYLLAGGPENGRGQLWVYSISGTKSSSPLAEHGTPQESQFSPDGRWVAYTSKESGRNEVYVVPFRPPLKSGRPTSADLHGKWQVSPSGGQRPKWRRDGRELFYMAPDSTLMSVAVTRGDSEFEVGAARPLFHPSPITPIPNPAGLAYDVSRDGKRFVFNVGVPPEMTSPITLVENWLYDFKK